MSTFTEKDLQSFTSRGVTEEAIARQIGHFRRGFPFAELVRPATPGDGIEVLDNKGANALIRYYDEHSGPVKTIKFVPASGAASRMFKALFEYLEQAKNTNQASLIEQDKGFDSPWNFIRNMDKFAFYDDLREAMKTKGLDIEQEISGSRYDAVIDALVNAPGLDYGNLPKGLLKFHSYGHQSRVAMEEHLVEAALYAASASGTANVHFTVSPEHLEKFRDKVADVKPGYEKEFGITIDVSFSVQKPSTDTIAVDMDNNPFREPDGSILFRPGGHGALIENLGDMDGDLIFIKNIDNVVPDRLKPETTRFKKAIGGLLLRLQAKAFEYLRLMEEGNPGDELLEKVARFAVDGLKIDLPADFETLPSGEKSSLLAELLNRPIRVCGMVKNEGEPGGGPFWIKNSSGRVSLQIVESSQINQKDEQQAAHLRGSTHFNPVDLVCGIRDFQGKKFDLHRFIDPETGFISVKSKGGKDLKAQELPGLWNGAMANWITVFVEVPIVTFNPVKTVNDLLRPQHQPK
jgi:hypothetical protein